MRRSLLILTCLMAACGGDAALATAVPTGAPVALGDSARLSLGVVTGDSLLEFDRVVTPFLLADGRVVVPLRGKSLIRVFGPDGTYQATLGRYGEGPGEFTALAGAWARGDTIEALDFMRPGIIRFLPDGSSQTIVLTGGGRTDTAIGPVSDGWALLRFERSGVGQRDQMSVQRFDRAGAHVGEVAKMEGFLRQESSAGEISGPTPLSPRARYRVHGGTIYLADTYEPAIRAFSLAGDSTPPIHWDPGAAPALDVALATVIDAAVASFPAGQAELNRRTLEGFPPPERVSVFWDFLVDDLGFFWISPFDPAKHGFGFARGAGAQGGGGGDWLVVAPDGATVGTVALPRDLDPMQITRDAVVGIARDELDVEYVLVYPLLRR
jgi:hypothetical protein